MNSSTSSSSPLPPPRTHLPGEWVRPASARQVTLFWLATLALFVLFNFAVRPLLRAYTTNGAFLMMREKWRMIDRLTQPVDWLILGDSSGNQGVDPSLFSQWIGGSAINLCTVGWLLPIEDAWKLDSYTRRLGPPKGVLIVRGHESWDWDLDQAIPCYAQLPLPWGFWKTLNPRLDIPPADLAWLFFCRYLPLYSENTTIADFLQHPLRWKPGNLDGYTNGFYVARQADPEYVERNTRVRLESRADHPFRISPPSRTALAAFCAYAQRYQVPIFIAHSPMYEGYYDTPEIRADIQHLNDWIRQETRNCPNVHLLLEEPMLFPKEAMQNPNHATWEAARSYTRRLALEIHAALGTPSPYPEAPMSESGN